ncbi:dihydroorotate dehydrogenase electron transfer subunit [Nitratireductor sp. ZSWI3]|uniref:dihydroorotate dehydrogenase electron transfer subunit n=1 Tax=Nitratireductor sp. ZSWI3 TaxID=2966359 RepID=UPI002150314E|nr:dihydroorotate dehydrogenase electron transfer subunit [Nitratireductor sp. ZSWI3]MCR4268452.1 dihydroorotate dehydrogenase electron transfer subunit [Nitratireductor sp. ZSWI3]
MGVREKIMPVQQEISFKAFEMGLAVKSNDPVNGEYRKLVLDAPAGLLARCRAGQFFHLLCPQSGGETPYLRRPMSIYGFYPQSGELHFLYKVTGAGTRALAALSSGERLNVLGPLGVPFTIADHWQDLVLVARGVGLATLAPLALEAQRLGRRLTAICSARHPDYLMSTGYFADLGADVITLTDAEGTSDPDNLERVIEGLVAAGRADAFYTCGSNRMLRLLQTIGARHGIPGQIALEQQMACGIGMCHCCVRPFNRGDKQVHLRVCREGPVFDMMEAIAW